MIDIIYIYTYIYTYTNTYTYIYIYIFIFIFIYDETTDIKSHWVIVNFECNWIISAHTVQKKLNLYWNPCCRQTTSLYNCPSARDLLTFFNEKVTVVPRDAVGLMPPSSIPPAPVTIHKFRKMFTYDIDQAIIAALSKLCALDHFPTHILLDSFQTSATCVVQYFSRNSRNTTNQPAPCNHHAVAEEKMD